MRRVAVGERRCGRRDPPGGAVDVVDQDHAAGERNVLVGQRTQREQRTEHRITVVGATATAGWARGGYNTLFARGADPNAVQGIPDGFVARIREVGAMSVDGSLCVTITPAAAVAQGAKWRRVGTETWFDSGITEWNVAPGACQVEFMPIPLWRRPASLTAQVSAYWPTWAEGAYAYSKNAVDASVWSLY